MQQDCESDTVVAFIIIGRDRDAKIARRGRGQLDRGRGGEGQAGASRTMEMRRFTWPKVLVSAIIMNAREDERAAV